LRDLAQPHHRRTHHQVTDRLRPLSHIGTTRLAVLEPLLTTRAPRLLPTVDADISRLQKLLDSAHHGTGWTPVDRLDRAAKARLDGATGQLLEDLSPVPDLLEVRKSA
ncbi:hypothetical protein ACFWJ5_33215, partial [Streptomyces qaidamensis]